MKKLTKKQKMFCREYAVDLNATKAARRAGYSEKTAHSIGHENLSKPEIIAELAEVVKKRCDECEINADMVLNGIKSIAIDPEAKHNDQLKAWELLGKYLKLFTDGKTVTVPEDYTFTMVVHNRNGDASS